MKIENNKRIKDILEKANKQALNGFDTSMFMQALLISKDGYIIGTGNWENANAEMCKRLYENVKKHPLLWKKFFMVG